MLTATLRDFFAQKGRLVLSALAVTLSVAFVAGTLLLTDTITQTLTRLTTSTAADVTVSVGTNADAQVLDAGILTADALSRVRVVEGVRAAYAVVESERLIVVDRHNRKVVATSGAAFLGRNWQPTGRLPVRLTSGREPRGPAEVVLDGDSADACGVRLGDRLRLVTAGGAIELNVVGIATVTAVNPGATLVFLNSASAAGTLLGRPGSLTAVEVEATAGTDHGALKQRVQAALGGGVTVATRAETARTAADDIGGSVAFLAVAMLGFGAVALLVGTFLIFNTFTMLVAARTRAVGLLRALGASRAQVSRSVLTEALLLGSEVTLDAGDVTPPVSPVVGRAAYRVVQEALTNVHKHAPGARVRVEVDYPADRVRVTVRNTPPTRAADIALPGTGTGLDGLRKRVEMVGGTVRAGPSTDGGFLVVADLPALPPDGRTRT